MNISSYRNGSKILLVSILTLISNELISITLIFDGLNYFKNLIFDGLFSNGLSTFLVEIPFVKKIVTLYIAIIFIFAPIIFVFFFVFVLLLGILNFFMLSYIWVVLIFSNDSKDIKWKNSMKAGIISLVCYILFRLLYA